MVPPTTEPMSEAESPAAEPNLVPHSEDEPSFTPHLYTPNFTSITPNSCPRRAPHNHPTTPDQSTHSPLYPIPMSALDSSPTSNTTTNTSPPPNKYKIARSVTVQTMSFIDNLCFMFDSCCMGNLSFFLGMEIHCTSKTIYLSQTRYVVDLIKKCNMESCKPSPTPMASTTHLSSLDVNQVCQFIHNPRTTQLQAVKRIYRYIKGTLELVLNFTSLVIISYMVMLTPTGACIFLGLNLLTWTAKKQSTVSRSSTEAEYMALATTTAELRWLCNLFRELKIPLRSPLCLFVDIISALHMAANPIFHARTCHIEIDYHFVREVLTRGVRHTQYISSHSQLANIFTKNLTQERFHSLASKLNLYFVPFR
ncbi:unnamed protein product, partial [Prunus brigantina]